MRFGRFSRGDSPPDITDVQVRQWRSAAAAHQPEGAAQAQRELFSASSLGQSPEAGGASARRQVPPPPPQQHVSLRFMLAHPAHLLALGFGAGLSPLAAGTVGTLWAWLSFGLVQAALPLWWHQGLLLGALTLLGWWAATITAVHLDKPDPGAVVCDEVVAFWLVLWLLLPASFGAQLWAFALFRFFDAVKPGPVRWADRHFKGLGWRGGWGIMLDDLVAAFCTLLVIALWRVF